MKRCRLVLEDGFVLEGQAFGADVTGEGEVVFHTSPFGYQEIFTDPSYAGQILSLAAPQVGNVGTNELDEESARPQISGLVVRELCEAPSNWRSTLPVDAYLQHWGIPGVTGVDTRKLVRHLRSQGSKRGLLSTESVSDAALVAKAQAIPSLVGRDLASALSTKEAYPFTQRLRGLAPASPAVTSSLHVVACDYGLKRSMLELLVEAGCRVTVVPASATAEAILALRPDGVFLTNGPGDPAAVVGAQACIQGLLGKLPLFGICLGHQLLALALGGRTFKMKFGHRGANHPVKELATGKVEITSQNHGFAVDAASLEGKAEVTHVNLNDGTVEGLAAPKLRAFSVQYHPESSPGPHDARHLFQRFLRMMKA